MEKEEVITWNTVVNTLEDLANSVQYYCIGVYGIQGSFVNESLARARKVCSEARTKLLEEKSNDS